LTPKEAKFFSSTNAGAPADAVRRARPYTVSEALRAANVVWITTGFPVVVVRVGVVLDTMPGDLTPKRAKLAIRLKITRDELELSEMLWTLADDEVRFRTALDAVRLMNKKRDGANELDKGTHKPIRRSKGN
jgi:hypothetical protein